MLRLVIVLAVLALGACATTAPPQPVADVQPVAPDARVLRYSDPGWCITRAAFRPGSTSAESST